MTKKRAGVDTDVWAVMDHKGEMLGGDYRVPVFWTKGKAREHQRELPGSYVVRVRIVQDPPLSERPADV